MVSVAQVGGDTQSIYVVVADVDAHAAQARAAGAHVIMEPADQEYGGRGYSAQDVEGDAWSFGRYDPISTTPRSADWVTPE